MQPRRGPRAVPREAALRAGVPGRARGAAGVVLSTPLTEDQTRAEHFTRLRQTPAFLVALLGGAVLAGILVGVLAGPGPALGAVVVTLLVVVGVTFALADSAAKQDFWTGFAASVGMTFQGRTELPTFTPILGAGDRRRCDEWLQGALPDGRVCGLGNYTYETRSRDSDGDTTWTPHRFTLAHVEVAAAEAPFLRGVFLRHRRMLRFLGDETLAGKRTQKLPTESEAFAARYDLLIERGENEARTLELFSPTFIDRLSRHPLEPSFDYVAGSLVVFTDKHTDDAGGLLALWDVTREIAARFDEEIAESRAARGDAGLR